MKFHLLLFVLPVVLAQDCCTPEQFETYIGVYLGYTERNVPDFEPQTYNGRYLYDLTNQRQLVLYVEYDFPGFENIEYFLSDFALNGTTTARFYYGFSDGSCLYQDFDNAFMPPFCWDLIYPLLSEPMLSTDIPVELYGDTTLNNYVMVSVPDCLPMISTNTLRNTPDEGTYQWQTVVSINTTLGISDPTEFDPPTDCDPFAFSQKELPMEFLHPFMNTAKNTKKP